MRTLKTQTALSKKGLGGPPTDAELINYESEMNANEVLRITSDFEHENERLRRLLRNMNTNICACHCGERFALGTFH